MATTTPNYGWPVPTSTDFVKDGATAIEALGDAIDATVFGLPSGALSLITTVTLSGTSFTVSNCFTSTYTNYLIVSNCATTATTQLDVLYQLRASGVTTTTGYTGSLIYNNQGAGPLRYYAARSSWIAGYGGNYGIGITNNIYAPQLAQRTTMTGLSSGFAAGGSQQGFVGGLLDDSTQYDSLVISAVNTMSGTLSIYGYAD